MRRFLRTKAHYKMTKAGFTGVNKNKYGKSFFAAEWRKFC